MEDEDYGTLIQYMKDRNVKTKEELVLELMGVLPENTNWLCLSMIYGRLVKDLGIDDDTKKPRITV